MQEPNSTEWTPPPPPEHITPDEKPEMSEVATLGNIFFEPGRTFEDLRRKPRFIAATIIMAVLITAFSFGIYYKVGDEKMRDFAAEQIDKSPQAGSMSRQDRESGINVAMTIGTVVRYAMPVLVIIGLLLGGLIYWLASKAFGGSGGFLHAVSTWVYASLPPVVVSMLASFIALAFKNPDDIDMEAVQSGTGVLPSSLAALVDGKTMPFPAAFLSMFDLFLIWGWALAIIGLQKTMRLSSGSAWAITLILAAVHLGFKLIGAAFK